MKPFIRDGVLFAVFWTFFGLQAAVGVYSVLFALDFARGFFKGLQRAQRI